MGWECTRWGHELRLDLDVVLWACEGVRGYTAYWQKQSVVEEAREHYCMPQTLHARHGRLSDGLEPNGLSVIGLAPLSWCEELVGRYQKSHLDEMRTYRP